MNAAVEVREAFKLYRSHGATAVALQGLTLTVEPGEIVVVLGPSGSGKTTLLRAVAGLEPLSAGSVRVFGTELTASSERQRAAFRAANIGFIDQHYTRSLSPDLSCRNTVALQLGLRGVSRAQARDVAATLLGGVGLANRADDRPQTLSGGEQQRVAVCAAVAHRPRLLLADEPAGELDADNAETIYALLAKLTRAGGSSALIVSHDRAAAKIADRLVHIRDGRLVAQALPGTPASLVVSKGWLRVPTELYDELGSPDLVAAERSDGGVILRAARTSVNLVSGRPRAASRPNGSSETVQELRDVVKHFRSGSGDRVVFSGLNRRICSGRLLMAVGRSGSGKTTLLHLLAGLERPTAGDVLLLGQPLSARSRPELAELRRRHIALVTQEPGLVPYLTALENVALGLGIRADTNGQGARARTALEDVGLGHRLGHRTDSLSAGERQRVAIARALAADVDLLLVDEPTARLDEESGRAVGELLAAAAHVSGRAVVCGTHDPVLLELADEVVELGSSSLRETPAEQRA